VATAATLRQTAGVPLYDDAAPYDEGRLDVGDGHVIAWSVAGNPNGKPAVVLHGGPGSGSSPRFGRLFDQRRYRIVQFDQRSCGASTPFAGDPVVDLSANTTAHLIDDVERLRIHLGIERWLVWGGSWGSTLGLAYAEAHPHVVSELVLASVVTTTHAEVDWVTRSMGRVFPEAWDAFVRHLPPSERDGNLAGAYHRLLMDRDPAVHHAAAAAWCQWEDWHVSLAGGFHAHMSAYPPTTQLCVARLVTHYWSNAAFMPDGALMASAHRLTDVPVFLAHGLKDISAPCDVPYRLALETGAELYIAADDGHGGPSISEWTVGVTDRLAASWRHE
jgi:proline iminopeptidase